MTETERFIVPAELVWSGQRPLLKMVEIDAASLAFPFWSQTLAAARRVVGLVALDEVVPGADVALMPSGFVYHFNRCGSTLVANAFKARKGCLVLSEPFIFQQLLDNARGTPGQRIVWLQRLMALHRQAFVRHADHLVIKWPGLVALYVADIEAAFPHVPAIFLHRNPIEVLVSARMAPLGNTDVVKEVHLALGAGERLQDYSALERSARYMANICRHVAPARNMALLDYAHLPGAIVEHVAPFFKLGVSARDLAAMGESTRYYSKDVARRTVFSADSSQKNGMANADEWRVTQDIIGPALLALQAALPQLGGAAPA
ncbi:MAG: hypothetical protein V4484_08220 [Pseudomonadota bacterium]